MGRFWRVYRRPKVDRDMLREHSSGIIAMTGCIAGRAPQRILEGDMEGARAELRTLIGTFGADSVFVELQDHDLSKEKMESRH